MDAESEWMGQRGGDTWRSKFVIPFYLKWMGLGPSDRDATEQNRELRTRAFELTKDEIVAMLTMQWRIQVVGTWFAIARSDPTLSEAVHRGFDYCHGTLTVPGLAAAVLTYPNSTTADVLQRYRERAIVEMLGGEDLVGAALQRLGDEDARGKSPAEQSLEHLMNIADRLQRLS